MKMTQDEREKLLKQKADKLAVEILEFSDKLPEDGLYQLNARLRQCGDSLNFNISDKVANNSKLERIRLLIKANSSVEETRRYLSLAEKLKIAPTKELIDKLDEISKMINETYHAAL